MSFSHDDHGPQADVQLDDVCRPSQRVHRHPRHHRRHRRLQEDVFFLEDVNGLKLWQEGLD